jgi:glycosyltransferase involved in cell wall biosynthesis
MTNVIHCVPSLGESGGGPSRSVSQLCNALCQQGSSIGIVTAVDPHDPIVPLNARIRLTKLEGRGTSFLDRLRAADFRAALNAVHQEIPISVIHQHGIWLRSSHAVISFAYSNKRPLVVAPRGMLEPWAINNSKWKKGLAWALYQKRDLERATAFHATALSEAESIRRLGFKQPIAVIPNGVELPEIVDGRWSMEDGESELRYSNSNLPGPRTALFLSRINPKKGLPMLLDAWKKLAPEDWRLVIAGNDDSNHLSVLERKIAELGLSDQVEVVGPLFGDDKEQAFLNANLFVLPSYSENFGIVVAEALSYQLPVLTTTGCPWKELQTERCGWWVDPTPAGIEAGLKAALKSSDSERREMGIRGRELVKRHYLWPAIAKDMTRFYDWLINGGEVPEFVELYHD